MNFAHPTSQKYVQNIHFTKFSYQQTENYIDQSTQNNKNGLEISKNLTKHNQKLKNNHLFNDISNLTSNKQQINAKQPLKRLSVEPICYLKDLEVNKCYFLNQEEKCVTSQTKKKKRKISVRSKDKKKLFLQFNDQDQQKDNSDLYDQISSQIERPENNKNSLSKLNDSQTNIDTIIETKAKRFNLMHNQLNFDSSSDQAQQQQMKSSSSQNSAQKITFQFPKLRSNIFLNDEQFQDSEDSASCSDSKKLQKSQVCEKDYIKENDQQDSKNKSKGSMPTTVTDFRRQHVNQGQSYLNKPLPINTTLDLIIKRDKTKKKSNYIEYFLYDSKTLKLLLIVRKSSSYQMYAKTNIQNPKAHPDLNYLAAKLQSNFLGNEFHLKIIDNKNKQQQLSQTITYEMNILGLNGPRKMNIYIPNDQKIKYKCDKSLQTIYDKRWKDSITKYVNKQATWNVQVNSYVLNLKGKAKMSSVKNFVIVKDDPIPNQQNSSSDDTENQKSYVIFGKVNRDIFNLTLAGPFTILQGLSIALSSFDRKITCQ